MGQERNTSIAIAKGIAIILMVMGHAECPGVLMNFIYLFHMPLFFITAGYFFSQKNVDQPWDFCRKRFKGLYVPFVKWSLFFLLIHNLMFHIGVLNETYGNWEGGVTHPYTLRQALQRAVHIVFSMGGYDEFLAGAFWFFRALLISSILFLVLYRLVDGRTAWLRGWRTAAVIGAAALGFAALKIGYGLKVNVVQGGIRETWGIAFFALGVIYRHVEDTVGFDRRKWWYWVALTLSVAVLVAGTCLHWAGMNLAPKLVDVATLPLTGLAGFFVVHQLSRLIDSRECRLRRALAHCGEMTLYIYVFHIIAFKVVSLLKIWWYGLDYRQVGCHMVIHEHSGDIFWILYTVAGVGLPLLWMAAYATFRRRVAS
ncbi:MAG: acyltransferase family protein [Muribaculaceae bacterium]